MNMMTQQEEFEQLAVPEFARKMEKEIAEEIANLDQSTNQTNKSFLDRIEWFRNLRIAGKIKAIFGTFFAVCFAMALVLGLGLGELWNRTQVNNEIKDGVLASVDLRGTTGELRYNSVRYIFGGEAIALERQRDSYEAAQAQLAQINGIVATHVPQMGERVAEIQTDLVEYNETFAALSESLAREGRSEASVALSYELSNKGDTLFADSRTFAIDLSAHGERMREIGVDYFFAMVGIVVALGFVATLILLLGLRYMSYGIGDSISDITDGMNRLAKGDPNFEIRGHARGDEIGDMAKSLELFKRANRQMEIWARERAKRAEEQIQEQKEREQERAENEKRKAEMLNELAKQFEHTVGDVVQGVAAASSQLQVTATKMASSAEQSSQRTSEVVQSMKEANSGATAAAAASDEFAMSIGEISRQATSSSELARLATDATKEADTTISELSTSAEQVGQVVELIQSIAQRTNLLALNASIEAARGGEAGRGFAVVASEVKELAMQTSRATEEVAAQINAMQDTTGASVNALRAIAGQVRDLESTAISIASAVDQQSVAGQDLARSIDMAARGTDQVSGHISDVRELSLSTGTAASQVLTSATDLEEQAGSLKEHVQAFLTRVRAG